MNEATKYIKNNYENVDQQYKPSYHLTAPIGWINDPNGFIYFKGEYHLFYQHYPYATKWGPMHWGHAKSKDLVNWEHLPVALEPIEEYEADGCFSGSAIEKDGRLYLMYTGHYERNGVKRETQCISYSDDGIHFEKYPGNPVISEKHISGIADISDFRDPKIFRKNDRYYCVIPSKTEDNRGQLLLFKSLNLFDWEFVSVLLEGDDKQGIMWECPDLFELDGKDVLIMSPIQMPKNGYKYNNISSTVAFIGIVDWESGKFKVESYDEIDSGMDFYAPQTCKNDKNERIMVAWMQMWGRTMPTTDLKHGWVGAMTLPRKLSVVNNKLIQQPIPIDDDYKKELICLEHLSIDKSNCFQAVISKKSIINLEISKGKTEEVGIKIGTKNENILISYDFVESELSLDRSNSGYDLVGDEKPILRKRTIQINPINEKLQLSLYLDNCSIEVFVNKEKAMTSTFYRKEKDVSLILESENSTTITELIIEEITI